MHSVSVSKMTTIRVMLVTHENERQMYLNIYSNAEMYTDELICLQTIEQCRVFDDVFLIITKELTEYSWRKLRSYGIIRAIFIFDKIKINRTDDRKRILSFSTVEILSRFLKEKIQIIQNDICVYNLYDSNNETKQSTRFIWYQLLTHILEHVPENNQVEEDFKEKYPQNFEWNLLNYAFQTDNFELMYVFRKNILNLQSKMKQSMSTNEQNFVYHKQLMLKDELQELKTHRNAIISLDNFLLISTENNREKFANDYRFHEHVQWEIPCYQLNSEHRININSIYRIKTIDFDNENQFWIIKLSNVTDWNCQKFFTENIQIDFGRILWKSLGNFTQANFYFQILLKTTTITNRNQKEIYLELAHMNTYTNDYDLALNYYQLALNLCEENSSEQIKILLSIKSIYQTKKNHEKILEYIILIYNIEEKRPSSNDDLHLLEYFEEIFCLFKKLEQYDQAIDFYRLKSPQFESNSANQIQLARIYILLASIFEDRNPKQADQFYQQAILLLQIYPQEESIFIQSLSTMINFYWKCRMFDRAVVCQMKLLDYRQRNPIHKPLDLAYALRDLARLYRVMNKLTEALDYFQQSLNILNKHLTSNKDKDVKMIQQEIFDLEEILKSLSATPLEDYNYRRQSNAHKNFLPTLSQTDLKTTGKETAENKKQQQSTICNIL